MTPPARHAAAIAILDAWRGGQPVEQALTRWARGARYAGSGDRAAIRDIVYDIVRRAGSAAAAGGGEDGRALVLGLLRLQDVDPALIFTGEGHAPAVLTSEEAAGGTTATPALDVPEWTLPLLQDRADGAVDALLESFSLRAPLWLRVALKRGTREEAQTALMHDGIATRAHSGVATALEVTEGARKLHLSQAYETGLVEPQDLSVQWAMARVNWPASGRILDYCAGGGGKALALADRTAAQILAHDALPRRMADVEKRALRAGVRIDQVDTSALARQAPFDAVLTDVPCSGSGTWRRDPEAKWRLTPDALAELVALQAEILDQAAPLVAPNGRLVYMTCSLFKAENEAQVADFVRRHPRWQVESQHVVTPLDASDGFFSAVFART